VGKRKDDYWFTSFGNSGLTSVASHSCTFLSLLINSTRMTQMLQIKTDLFIYFIRVIRVLVLLNRIIAAQGCEARKHNSSNAADYKKIPLKPYLCASL